MVLSSFSSLTTSISFLCNCRNKMSAMVTKLETMDDYMVDSAKIGVSETHESMVDSAKEVGTRNLMPWLIAITVIYGGIGLLLVYYVFNSLYESWE